MGAPTVPTIPTIPNGGGVAYGESSLTLSGNEITDAVRTAGVEGDGLAIPGGYGIWPEAENILINGGFETNPTGWAAVTSQTIAQSTEWSKFGAASLKITNLVNENHQVKFDFTFPSAGTYVVSMWINVSSDFTGGVVQISSLNYTGSSFGSPVTASAGDIKRITRTITVAAGDLVGSVTLYASGTISAGTIYIDGVQIETGSVATPYIETDGGTASRSAARVQATVADLGITATQGWVAVRKRLGTVASGTYYDFTYRDADNNNRLNIAQQAGTPNWQMIRLGGGAGSPANSATTAQTVGQHSTIVGMWTATQVGISVDGSAFATTANSSIPVLAASQVDFGSFAGASQGDGNYLWLATGAGTLTDADAAALDAFGSTHPFPAQLVRALSPNAQVKSLWYCVDGTLERIW